MSDDLISVYCLVLPDGNTYWMPQEKATSTHVSSFIQAWKESLPDEKRVKYENEGVTTGMVMIYMLRSDYENLYATNLVDWSKVDD